MAKETAHQLGTPMSSLMAWVGLLEQEGVNPEYLREMNKDVERLNTVVDRFSKIGSDPKLTQEELGAVVASTVDYMRPRIGGRVRLSFVDRSEGCRVALSVPLISWVLENLIRNAVDAMEGEGEVAVLLHRVPEGWAVDVRDTGKGIPRAQWSEVFQPGFTTKARGWGLGLSLTKRIIEGVHKGKIFVLDSEVGSHTVFRVLMK
jgi:signal transduction histidine kinase